MLFGIKVIGISYNRDFILSEPNVKSEKTHTTACYNVFYRLYKVSRVIQGKFLEKDSAIEHA